MKGKYMEISMQKIFECLESTVNKSILEKFQNFLKQYPDVDKWFINIWMRKQRLTEINSQ